jgi:DNA polymerase-4
MNLSRDILTSIKSPWTPERKMKEWLEDQAENGWFLDSFKFKFMNCSVEFTFRRCEPVEAEFCYTTMVPQLFDKEAYEKDLEDESEIRQALKVLSKSVSDSVISQNMLGFTVSITIRYYDFYTITRSMTISEPICNEEEIYLRAVSLFERNYDNRPVRLLGVTLSSLKEKREVLQQMSIFDLNINKKTTTEIINDLNKLLDGNYLKKASEVENND